MRILVTGAAGFIGSHTCQRLVADGHAVVGLDSFDDYLYPAAIKRQTARELSDALPARFTLLEGDICDAAAVARAIDGVDVVCHLAALAGVRPSLAEPLRYIRTNLEGTGVIFEACRQRGIDRVVFASSSSVYGARPGEDLTEVAAFREDDPCLHPASPYAASKRAGELLCTTYTSLFGIGISALRYFTVYGPRQRPDMAIHKFVRAVASGEPITLFGDGKSRRDYTFIDDIVDGTVRAIERVTAGAYRVYNLGGTRTTALTDLVAIIEEVTGKTARIEHAPDQPGDVPITFADITGAHRDLGYQPRTGLRDGIEAFWRWYRSRH